MLALGILGTKCKIMRIPTNMISSKYTSGKEYMYAASQKEYQGHYYEANNKTFAGKSFDAKAPELIKIQSKDVNTLLTRSATYLFGTLSKLKLNNKKPSSFLYKGGNIRYFLKQINVNPILIKEVDKNTFNQFKTNSFYIGVELQYDPKIGFNDNDVEAADKKMIGLKEFLRNLNFNPASDNDNYPIGQG